MHFLFFPFQKSLDNYYTGNTGVSITAPIFFNAPGWEPPKILVSEISCKVLDKMGYPLKNTMIEVWNIGEKLTELITNEQGEFEIKAPSTIDVRFTLPDGQKEQQWLFYEYPPLLDLIENIYTISWSKDYPNLNGGQMPWEAFRFNEIKEVLKKVNWTIKPSDKIMLF